MKFNILNLLYNIVMVALLSAAAVVSYGTDPTATLLTLTSLACIYQVHLVRGRRGRVTGAIFMAGQVQIWTPDIEKQLFKENEFLQISTNHDGYVQDGKYVHIPQSGEGAEVVKNPNVWPLTVSEHEDTEITYQLDYYATKPKRISWSATQELNYDFRANTIETDLLTLKEEIAEDAMYNWLHTPAMLDKSASTIPAARVIAVTGANGSSNAEADAATGNRKKAALADLQAMQTKFRTEKRWSKGNMYALLTPTMLAEIAPSDSVITATYFQGITEEERRQGVYMNIQGWKIMDRSSVLRTQADGTLRAPKEAGAATDCSASLFWRKDAVCYAKGEIKYMEKLDQPEWGGDIYNFHIRMGGRAKRADFLGIAVLRQTATA